jgi:beta-glucosidase-like glycosyl hydrolase
MTRDFLRTLAPHMIVGLAGPRILGEERDLLSEYPFSGVILFDRNVSDARSLMDLTRGIRSVFREAHGAVPLIAADHEGGIISVLGRAIGVPPTQMAVARTGNGHLCERLFAENARRMRASGVNMLLGPVADVNSERRNPVIGTRSFGEESGIVSALVSTAVSAARREGVLTCIKHFPGHGPSSVDSHLALPVLEATLGELREKDIPPFASGIAAGAETVMIGHIAPLGRSLPASLDPEIIGGILRGELGFEGVAITDALEMEGVRVAGLGEICARALEAGNDILLFSKPVAEVAGELEGAGSLPARDESRDAGLALVLKRSFARIEILLGIAAKKEREFELPADPGVYEEIAAASIRVSRGADAAPGIDPERGFNAVFYAGRGEFDRHPVKSFISRVLKGLGEAAERCEPEPYDAVPSAACGLEARIFSSRARREPIDAVFLLNRKPLEEGTVRSLSSQAGIVVVAGWPYAMEHIPPGKTVIVTYGVYDAAARAVSESILKM